MNELDRLERLKNLAEDRYDNLVSSRASSSALKKVRDEIAAYESKIEILKAPKVDPKHPSQYTMLSKAKQAEVDANYIRMRKALMYIANITSATHGYDDSLALSKAVSAAKYGLGDDEQGYVFQSKTLTRIVARHMLAKDVFTA